MVNNDSCESQQALQLTTLRQIAETVPTPVIVHFGRRIATNLTSLRHKLSNICIRVSLKAASSPHVLRSLANGDVGIDVSSIQEYEAALSYGIQSSRIAFYSPGAASSQLVSLSRNGVRVLLDTSEQVEAYCRDGRGVHVGLRIQCDTKLRQNEGQIDCASSPKFGIPRSHIWRVERQLDESGVKVVELSAHLGSMIHTVDPYIRLASELVEIANEMECIDAVNLGGGLAPTLATPPTADIHALNGAVTSLREQSAHPLQVVLEPGRCIFADTTAIVASVTAVKTINEDSLVISDARFSTAGLQCELATLDGHNGHLTCAVYGDSCSPFDYIGQLRYNRLREGDKIVIFNVGAYAIQLYGHLQLRPKGTEVFVTDGGNWEISRRALNTKDFLHLMV